MAEVSLRGVVKRYGATQVVHGASLEIAHGEFVVFVGPSGCGKSTLLRMVAGLEGISAGKLLIDGQVVNHVPARDRGVAMVFQSYALYPHMTVAENMGFALANIGTPKEEIDRRVKAAAEILQITPMLGRRPKDMSGGQRQRVAIGRSIVREPKVFLFDEPLSNLDAALRVQMRAELAKLHHKLGATMIYVTHDQTEAMTMADRIVVLRAGHIEQVGAPMDLYRNPRNMFVAGFLGSPRMNFLKGSVTAIKDGVASIQCAARAILRASVLPGRLNVGDSVNVGIRPEHLQASGSGAGLSGQVDVIERLGNLSLLYITLDSGEQVIAESREESLNGSRIEVGKAIHLEPSLAAIQVFDKSEQSVTDHARRAAPTQEAA